MGKNKFKKLALEKVDRDHKFRFLSKSGNLAFLEGHMKDAIENYSDALKIRPKDETVLSNRGMAYYRVRDYEKAIADFYDAMELEAKMGNGSPTLKTTHRFCKVNWAVKNFETLYPILDRVAASAKNISELKEVNKLVATTRRMEHEAKTGDYDMVNLLQRKEQIYDCSEYVGPVQVKEKIPGSSNFGSGRRGIVAMGPIKAGQVILGCKAFAIVFPRRPSSENQATPSTTNCNTKQKKKTKNASSCKVDCDEKNKKEDENEKQKWGHAEMSDNFTRLVECVFDMVLSNPDLLQDVCTLFCKRRGRTTDDDGNLKLLDPMMQDVLQLEKVILNNATLSASNPDPSKMLNYNEIDIRICRNTYGLWYYPSLLNHSCVDVNADYQIFGDLMIVRALKDIAVGEEILVSYMNYSMLEQECYVTNENVFQEATDFVCQCRLCTLVVHEPNSVKKKRGELVLYAIQCADNDELEDVTMKLEALRSDHPDLNFCIYWICEKIASINDSPEMGMYRKAASYFEKAYNLTLYSGLSRHNRIRLAIKILICYIKLDDEMNAIVWGKKLKMDLICCYGGEDKPVQLRSIIPILAKAESIDLDLNTMYYVMFYCCSTNINDNTDETGDDIDEESEKIILAGMKKLKLH